MDCSPAGPLFMGFSRHEYGSGLPCPPPGDPPNPGIHISFISCTGRQVLYHSCHMGSPWKRACGINIYSKSRSTGRQSPIVVVNSICLLMAVCVNSGAEWWMSRRDEDRWTPLPHRRAGASQVVPMVKNPCANAGDGRDASLIPRLGRFPGGGHGNPFQCSCLENHMDRGAWRATQSMSQTQLKWLGVYAHTKGLGILHLWLYKASSHRSL